MGRGLAVFGGHERGRSVEPGGGEGGVLDGLAPEHVDYGHVGAAGHGVAGLVEVVEGMMGK